LNKVRRLSPKGNRKPSHDEQRRVPSASLNPADIRQVEVRFVGELFLGHAACLAQAPHIPSYNRLPIHRRMGLMKLSAL
jgi:hypothetical protein